MDPALPPTKTIPLAVPLAFGDNSWTAIELREPTTGEVIRANKAGATGLSADLVLISLVSGIPANLLEAVPISKAMEASRYLAGFISPPGPPTGDA